MNAKSRHVVITGAGGFIGGRLATRLMSDPDFINDRFTDAERLRAGVTPRKFSNEEIVRRYLAAMINEGANVVLERIAPRPLDVDVVLIFGYGFPRYRGGPMKFADMTGLRDILADIEEFAMSDALFWKPSPLLLKLVARGADFDSLNPFAESRRA